MHWSQPFDRFDFHDQAIVHQQIDPECVVYDNAIIIQRQDDLSGNGYAATSELGSKQRFVRRFEQAWSQIAVHPVPAIDDLASKRFERLVARPLCVFV
jgi:hypothetical protein